MKWLERRPELVALGSVGIGAGLVVAKLVVGLLTGSLGILSEAGHSLFDLAASIFTLFAVRTSRKPADPEHPYGHGRTENLAAFAEGMLLVIIALVIAFEAVRRLIVGGPPVDPTGYAFALLVGTILIESGRAVVMSRIGRAISSDAMLADATDRLADVLANMGVLVGLVGVRLGLVWADAAAALVVAIVILRAAGLLTWRSGDILIDRAPAGAEEKLRDAIQGSTACARSGPCACGGQVRT